MNRRIIICATLIVASLVIQATAFSDDPSKYDVASDINRFAVQQRLSKDEFSGMRVVYMHLNASSAIKPGASFDSGALIGSVEPFPKVVSKNFDGEYRESERLYGESKFKKAADILKKAVKKEPDNHILLNQYARSLYRAKGLRESSFPVYRDLVRRLDAQLPEEQGLKLDMWFLDAYWKLGTLHMDRKEYREAIRQIAKIILGTGNRVNPRLREEAFSYITEAYYFLGQFDNVAYYGAYTLRLNPRNKYVLEFMKKRAGEEYAVKGDGYRTIKISEIYKKWNRMTEGHAPGISAAEVDKVRFIAKYIGRPYKCSIELFVDSVTLVGMKNLVEEIPVSMCIKLKTQGGKKVSVYIQDILSDGFRHDVKKGSMVELWAGFFAYRVDSDVTKNSPVLLINHFEPK